MMKQEARSKRRTKVCPSGRLPFRASFWLLFFSFFFFLLFVFCVACVAEEVVAVSVPFTQKPLFARWMTQTLQHGSQSLVAATSLSHTTTASPLRKTTTKTTLTLTSTNSKIVSLPSRTQPFKLMTLPRLLHPPLHLLCLLLGLQRSLPQQKVQPQQRQRRPI